MTRTEQKTWSSTNQYNLQDVTWDNITDVDGNALVILWSFIDQDTGRTETN